MSKFRSGYTCQEFVGPASGSGQQREHGVPATKHYRVGSLDIWVCTMHSRTEYRDLIPDKDFTTDPPTLEPVA